MATIYKYKTTTTVDVYRDINSFDRNENPISTIPSDKFVYGKYENSAQTFRQFYNDPGGIQSIGWAKTNFFIKDISYSPATTSSSTTTNTTPKTNTNTSPTKTKPKTNNTTVVNGTVLPNSNIYSQYIVKVSGGLNIRQTTNANSTALGSLPNGTRIYAKSAIATGWSEYSKDGKFPTGYVSSKYLEKVTEASPPFAPVTPITSPTFSTSSLASLVNLTPKPTVYQANRADTLQNLENNNILQQDLKNVAALLDPLKTAALNGTLNKDTLKAFGNQLWETEKQKLIKAGTDNELITLYKTKYDLIKKELQLEAEHALAIIKLKYLRTPKAVLTNAATGSERTANAGDIIRGEGNLGETGSFGPTLSQQLNNQQVVTDSGTVDEATLRLNEAIAGSRFIPASLKFEIPTSIGDLYPLDQKVIDDYLAAPTESRTELTVANLYYYIQNSSEVQKRNEQYTQKIAELQRSQIQPQINQNGGFTNTNPFTPNGGLPASFAGNGVTTVNGFNTTSKKSPLTSLTSYTPSPQLQTSTNNIINANISFLQSSVASNNNSLNKYNGITDKRTNSDAAIRWLKLWLAEDTSYKKNKSLIDKAQEENNKAINEILKDPFKKIKEEYKKRKEARDALKRRTKAEKRACRKRRAKKLAKATLKTITPILINYLSNKLIDVVAQNNKIRALVERTNNYILLYEGEDPVFVYTSPSSLYTLKTTSQGVTAGISPITLSFAKKVRDNAIKIINNNRKLLNDINKGIENAQKYISIFDVVVTIISSIPIPTSVPPGIGVPVNLIMKFVKILDKANRIILAISNYLPQVTSILEPAIEKLNEYESQIKAINETLDNAAASGVNDTPAMVGSGQNSAGTTDPSVNGVEYQGFRFAIREEDTTYGSKALKRHYAVAIDANDTEVLQSERSFTLDPEDLVEQLKVVIDRRKLSAGVRVSADGQTQSSGSFQVAGAPDAEIINNLSDPYRNIGSATQIQQQIQAQQQQQQLSQQQFNQQQQEAQQQRPPLTQAQRRYYQDIVMNRDSPIGLRQSAELILRRNYV